MELSDHKDEWSEDEAKTPARVTDTMLMSTDFLEDNVRQNILIVVPAEGNRPLSIFRDKYSEELAYSLVSNDQRVRHRQLKFFIVIFVNQNCEGQIDEQQCVLKTYSIRQRNYE